MVENGKTVYYIFLRGDNMGGLEELMKDLGVKNYEELDAYINSEEHQDEQIVKDLKELIEYVREKGDVDEKKYL